MQQKDFQEVKGELAQLTGKVNAAEVVSTAVENRLVRLEANRGTVMAHVTEMRRLLEEQEDRGKRS